MTFNKKRGGFTLLELIVVIAILAIIGGGLVASFSGLEDDAAEGSSAYSISALDQIVRTYMAVERSAPNDLDALVATTYVASGPVTGAGTKFPLLPSRLQGSLPGTKSLTHNLTASQATALRNVGITHLRYADARGADPLSPAQGSGGTVTLGAPSADGPAAIVGPLLDIDIPHRAFETPRGGSNNRGRGFRGEIGTSSPVLIWNPNRSGGTGGYDNIKIGAEPNDVLVLLGVGNESTIVGHPRAGLPSAPIFNRGIRTDYGRYLLVFNVTAPRTKATLQCVLTTHGDFLDEMIGEHGNQKLP